MAAYRALVAVVIVGVLSRDISTLAKPAEELKKQELLKEIQKTEHETEEADKDVDELEPEYEEDDQWPAEELHLGQIAGLAMDNSAMLHIFHRDQRNWDPNADEDVFSGESEPIKAPTLLKMDPKTAEVLDKWGANMFHMPHGLTIDSEGNFWVTDVARHQVFKLKYGSNTPLLTLGKKFQSATDNYDMERFCMPTDVAVASNGDFFVSDGYCNSRVLKYSKNGTVIGMLGEGEFYVPHSLALAEDLDLICIADREYQRIVCLNAGIKDPQTLGNPSRFFRKADDDELIFGESESIGRIYAIEYHNGLLYAVNGSWMLSQDDPKGFIINLREEDAGNDYYNGAVKSTFAPFDTAFAEPHDLTVSPDGSSVFVGEIGPNNIWKFVKKV